MTITIHDYIKQFTVDLTSVETNMVFFDMADPRITPGKLCQALETVQAILVILFMLSLVDAV
uniref:Uncharacterized protein n=1 Tax=Aegilops tauschii subsp. strangulata TaxID=200361 RepID=A0A453R532_AEGTS